jgi:hypothetical protein
MEELSKKREQFCRQWEKRRKNKWLYVLLHGTVYRGLPMTLVVILLNSKFKIENINWSLILNCAIAFGLLGIFYGLREFKRDDMKYLYLLNDKDDDEEIIKGIQTLRAGNQWRYENLKIHNDTDESLTIQNELFWFDERVPSSEKLDECYQSVYGNFRRLQRNKDFDEYTKNRRVAIQIFDNSQSNVPLLEKAI